MSLVFEGLLLEENISFVNEDLHNCICIRFNFLVSQKVLSTSQYLRHLFSIIFGYNRYSISCINDCKMISHVYLFSKGFQ